MKPVKKLPEIVFFFAILLGIGLWFWKLRGIEQPVHAKEQQAQEKYLIEPTLLWRDGRIIVYLMEYDGDRFILVETLYDGHVSIKELQDK